MAKRNSGYSKSDTGIYDPATNLLPSASNSAQPPKSREEGGGHDADAVNELFTSLGFKVHLHKNKKEADIKTIVTELCRQDHDATSCVAVVIMTHGYKNGILYAYDKTYLLYEIIEIFENGHNTLVHKPKLFFIQALGFDFSHCKTSKQLGRMALSDEACRGELVDPGKITYYDGQGQKSVHVPTHIEYLFANSTVEDYRAWRQGSGSWFIKELCKVIKTHRNNKDLLQMLTLVTKGVAYDCTTYTPDEPALNNKKGTPETRSTLTKLLKF